MHIFEAINLVAFALMGAAMVQTMSLFADAAKQAAQNDEQKRLKDSEEATKKWLSLVDAGEYEKSWDAASKVLQLTVPRAQWKIILDQIRKPLKKAETRKMTDVRVSKDPHGLPPGDYMVFVYQTKFAEKENGYEILTLVFDEDKWQVMTYQVN